MMKDRNRGKASGVARLTVEEHLWLHRKMERRALELWLEGSGRRRTTLNNWLEAEREVWAEFARLPASGGRGNGVAGRGVRVGHWMGRQKT
jgi:hypothetical protein